MSCTIRLFLLALIQQAPPAEPVYVANQDAASITVIDAARNAVVDIVDLKRLGFSPTAKPHHVAVEPDGSFWYVSLIGDNRVLKFDRANRLVGQARFDQAGMLALHPSRDLLFVTHSMTAVNPDPTIGVIRRSDMEIEEVDVLIPRPHAVAVAPAGSHVYVGSLGENRIAVMEVETQRVRLVDVPGDRPHSFVQFAISPASPIMVASAELTNLLLVFDLTRPESPSLVKSVPVNPMPWDPVFTPDGRFVYFGNQRSNTVTVVDASEWTVASVIEGEGLSDPYGSAVSPDGRYVYIANRWLHSGGGEHSAHGAGDPGRKATVVVIDTGRRAIQKVIEVPGDATGVGARPAALR
ncbi:PE-PGRS family protein PE_PGRS18 [bacterium HR33]|nr:PE-PGRS family protein PE_PGRS18 [bacterium HR33]